MPLYEYICSDCGNEFEKMMRFDQAGERPPCPRCTGKETRKKLSLFSSGSQAGGVSSSGSCGSGSGGFT
jgi:putative FmdB family regulatory protein